MVELIGVEHLRDTIDAFRAALARHAAHLDDLNVYPVPDGDTGTNMARTLDAVVAQVERAEPVMAATCHAISHGSLLGARGNSGVILSQLLRGMVGVLEQRPEVDALTWADALRAGATAAYAAVLRPVEGTILTVARQVADAAEQAARHGDDLMAMLEAAQRAGHDALDETPRQLAALAEAGVVDAGGAGFLLLLDAALYALDGRPLPDPPAGSRAPSAGSARSLPAPVSALRYEVMYLLDLDDERIDEFKGVWAALGDSIVVVGGDGTWNCHVHTDDVGAVIEAALDTGGRPKRIRVTDLQEQVAHLDRCAEKARTEAPVTTAVVAVASGPGLAALFRSLGVHGIVDGGQSRNPSAAELLAAIEAAPADDVVVLPNNSNVVPVAHQVTTLTGKRVLVVPTRSMPEALAALVAYDPDGDAADNASAMSAAIEPVRSGEVTQAVRDASTEIGSVRAGDWVGLVRGEGIVTVAADVLAASRALLDHLLGEGEGDGQAELVTVVEGEGASAPVTGALWQWVRDRHPGVEVEVHQGGQPLYPYLFGVE